MRDRILNRLADFVISRPRATLIVGLILAALCATVLPRLQVLAGHSSMMYDNIHQKRFRNFLKRFGSPNLLFVMVEGGEKESRRQVIDKLGSALPAQKNAGNCKTLETNNAAGCVRDVLGRLDLTKMKERALFFLPALDVKNVTKALQSDKFGLDSIIKMKGLADFVGAMAGELEKRSGEAGPTGEAAKRAEMVMTLLGKVFDEIDTRVRGKENSTPLHQSLIEGLASDGKKAGIDSKGYFSGHDGSLLVAVVRPVNDSDEPTAIIPFVNYVEAHARKAIQAINKACDTQSDCKKDLRVTLTGLPALVADEKKALSHDLPLTSGVATIGVLVLFIFGFRSIRQGLLGLFPLGLSLICTLAFVHFAFGGLNMMTSAFIATVLGLGIDFAVHLIARYNEARHRGEDSNVALKTAITRAGPGILTGALTTAGAFAALAVNEFKGFSEMGIISAVGLVLALLATITIGPAAVVLIKGLQKVPKPRHRLEELSALPKAIIRLRVVLLVSGVLISGLMLWQASNVPWSYDYLALLPRDRPSVDGMKLLSEKTDFSGEVAAIQCASLEEAKKKAALLEKLPTVGRVESLASFIPTDQAEKLKILKPLKAIIGQTLPDWTEAEGLDRLPPVDLKALDDNLRDLADSFEDAQFAAKQASHPAAIYLGHPAKAIRRLRETLKKTPPALAQKHLAGVQREIFDGFGQGLKLFKAHLDIEKPLSTKELISGLPAGMRERMFRDGSYALYVYPSEPIWAKPFMKRFIAELRTVDPAVTGFPVTHWENGVIIESGFQTASLLTLAALFIFLLIDFRSIKFTLLAMIPLGVGLILMWGGMSVLEMQYNFANIIAFPLIAGIGVASGVHILHRFRQQGEAEITHVVQHTGMAIFLSAATTMAGFGSLTLAQHQGAASLGTLLLLGVGACLATSTLLLPAILRVFWGAKAQ
jgi:uncharacterized protein